MVQPHRTEDIRKIAQVYLLSITSLLAGNERPDSTIAAIGLSVLSAPCAEHSLFL